MARLGCVSGGWSGGCRNGFFIHKWVRKSSIKPFSYFWCGVVLAQNSSDGRKASQLQFLIDLDLFHLLVFIATVFDPETANIFLKPILLSLRAVFLQILIRTFCEGRINRAMRPVSLVQSYRFRWLTVNPLTDRCHAEKQKPRVRSILRTAKLYGFCLYVIMQMSWKSVRFQWVFTVTFI